MSGRLTKCLLSNCQKTSAQTNKRTISEWTIWFFWSTCPGFARTVPYGSPYSTKLYPVISPLYTRKASKIDYPIWWWSFNHKICCKRMKLVSNFNDPSGAMNWRRIWFDFGALPFRDKGLGVEVNNVPVTSIFRYYNLPLIDLTIYSLSCRAPESRCIQIRLSVPLFLCFRTCVARHRRLGMWATALLALSPSRKSSSGHLDSTLCAYMCHIFAAVAYTTKNSLRISSSSSRCFQWSFSLHTSNLMRT